MKLKLLFSLLLSTAISISNSQAGGLSNGPDRLFEKERYLSVGECPSPSQMTEKSTIQLPVTICISPTRLNFWSDARLNRNASIQTTVEKCERLRKKIAKRLVKLENTDCR